VLLLLAAAGCGTETDERPATFSYIHQAILVPSCASAACHNALNEREDLVLDDPEVAYEEFLASGVVPGLPDESGILFRLRGELTDGARMPLDSPLPDADILLIQQWIIDGAGDN
jgi:hypothetical protein